MLFQNFESGIQFFGNFVGVRGARIVTKIIISVTFCGFTTLLKCRFYLH